MGQALSRKRSASVKSNRTESRPTTNGDVVKMESNGTIQIQENVNGSQETKPKEEKKDKKKRRIRIFSLKRSRKGSGRKKSKSKKKEANGSERPVAFQTAGDDPNRQSLFMEDFQIPEEDGIDAVSLSSCELENNKSKSESTDLTEQRNKKGTAGKSPKNAKKNKKKKAKTDKKKEEKPKKKKSESNNENVSKGISLEVDKSNDENVSKDVSLEVDKSVEPLQKEPEENPQQGSPLVGKPTEDHEVGICNKSEEGDLVAAVTAVMDITQVTEDHPDTEKTSPPASPVQEEMVTPITIASQERAPEPQESSETSETSDDKEGTPKRVSLGPRLKTAILRKNTGDSEKPARVTLSRPKTVEITNLVPPPRKKGPRRPVSQTLSNSDPAEAPASASKLEQASLVSSPEKNETSSVKPQEAASDSIISTEYAAEVIKESQLAEEKIQSGPKFVQSDNAEEAEKKDKGEIKDVVDETRTKANNITLEFEIIVPAPTEAKRWDDTQRNELPDKVDQREPEVIIEGIPIIPEDGIVMEEIHLDDNEVGDKGKCETQDHSCDSSTREQAKTPKEFEHMYSEPTEINPSKTVLDNSIGDSTGHRDIILVGRHSKETGETCTVAVKEDEIFVTDTALVQVPLLECSDKVVPVDNQETSKNETCTLNEAELSVPAPIETDATEDASLTERDNDESMATIESLHPVEGTGEKTVDVCSVEKPEIDKSEICILKEVEIPVPAPRQTDDIVDTNQIENDCSESVVIIERFDFVEEIPKNRSDVTKTETERTDRNMTCILTEVEIIVPPPARTDFIEDTTSLQEKEKIDPVVIIERLHVVEQSQKSTANKTDKQLDMDNEKTSIVENENVSKIKDYVIDSSSCETDVTVLEADDNDVTVEEHVHVSKDDDVRQKGEILSVGAAINSCDDGFNGEQENVNDFSVDTDTSDLINVHSSQLVIVLQEQSTTSQIENTPIEEKFSVESGHSQDCQEPKYMCNETDEKKDDDTALEQQSSLSDIKCKEYFVHVIPSVVKDSLEENTNNNVYKKTTSSSRGSVDDATHGIEPVEFKGDKHEPIQIFSSEEIDHKSGSSEVRPENVDSSGVE